MIDYQVTSRIAAKLRNEHSVSLQEVDEALDDERLVTRRVRRNRKKGETTNRYIGRTRSGRLLRILIIIKPSGTWLMSAYDGGVDDQQFYQQG